MALTLDGTAGITFPVTAGSASAVQASSGRVLQVVNATYGTQVSSSTNTFVDTGLTATITPSSATSKILIFVDQAGCTKDTGNTSLQLQLLRGSTQIVYMDDIGAITSSTAANECGSIGTNYLDSPSTTSAVTYKTQFRSRSNIAAVYVQGFGSTTPSSTITLMEIAA